MSAGSPPVRWGIVGTANIARAVFLPGMRQAGGTAEAVASRDLTKAEQYAAEHGIARAVDGYQALIDDPAVEALYVPLPNSMHADWVIAALRAGKPVLSEKPLCGNLADTERVLAVARETGTLLWEAFAFPFQAQMTHVREAVGSGAIGELREIQSSFHFMVRSPDNIRLSAELEGGALNDVGCYPIRLALDLFGEEHQGAWADAVWGGRGVDVDSWGSLEYAGGRRLMLSCGLRRSYDTFTRLLGDTGEIRISNPFHPSAGDSFQVLGRDADHRTEKAADQPSFAPAIRHIQAVLRGEEEPRLLAIDTALPVARALHDLHACLKRQDAGEQSPSTR
jgi:predicted dehydrogenase